MCEPCCFCCRLVEEKQQWDQLVETYTNRTTEVCRLIMCLIFFRLTCFICLMSIFLFPLSVNLPVCLSNCPPMSRYADAEQSVKLGLDGLPLFLTDKEKDFILAQPNLQEIVSKVEASFQEVEATVSQLHISIKPWIEGYWLFSRHYSGFMSQTPLNNGNVVLKSISMMRRRKLVFQWNCGLELACVAFRCYCLQLQ